MTKHRESEPYSLPLHKFYQTFDTVRLLDMTFVEIKTPKPFSSELTVQTTPVKRENQIKQLFRENETYRTKIGCCFVYEKKVYLRVVFCGISDTSRPVAWVHLQSKL